MNKHLKILEAAKAAEASVTGKLGFSFYDLQTGDACYLHEEELFPTASVYKVFILAELYRQASEGLVDLSAMICSPVDRIAMGSGILCKLTPGIQLSVRDMATLMMVLSDNVATDVLFNLVGRDNILNHVIRPLGLKGTKADYDCSDMREVYYQVDITLPREEQRLQARRGIFRNAAEWTCQTEMSNCTTPKDMTVMYKALYDGTWVNRQISDEMLQIMRPDPARISKYLPSNVTVSRKSGSMDRVVNDTGIVYTPKGAYIITMFYNGNTASEAEYKAEERRLLGEKLLEDLSKKVYDIFMDDAI